MRTNQQQFITTYLPLARQVEARFGLNPVVILAQAALESGWGQSKLATEYHNFFGICGYGRPNEFWSGMSVELGKDSPAFRRYREPLQSFMDYGRLITTAYKTAAGMSYHPEAFAKEIAYSKYISEVNGDNREAYRSTLARICKQLTMDN
ncbi:MAG: glucosaminidase domain-containing protein [Tannerellaceae bacterium]|nr:glucosaminidase domain-containing protein [Tannerellaceae bacterium]